MSPRWPRGLSTWPAIDTFDGNVLLVINSPVDEADRVAGVLATIEARTRPGGVHVIAHPEWTTWLSGRMSPDRLLLSVARVSGKPVEVNHFLLASEALLWVVPKAFQAIVGSTPHNQYNEEIQPVFEQRISLLIGDGVFLAHCLPLPYVYVLDAAALVHRFGRESRVRTYQADARRLVDDLHRLWQERGMPAREDDQESGIGDQGSGRTVMGILEQHLGRAVVTFDDASPSVIPLPAVAGSDEGARVLHHLREVLHARDVLLAERSEAVEIRDRLLEQMHRDNWSARVRRLIGRGD